MSKRDIAAEGDLYNIEENGFLNGIYILSILHFIEKPTFDQVAIGMYLFRFVNIMSELLDPSENNVFISQIPEWDKNNLDVMLSSVIIEKYNSRFLSGLKELMSREMITTNNEYIVLKDDVRSSLNDLFEDKRFELIIHKAKYVSRLMEEVPLDLLNERIKIIVGGA